MQKTPNSLKRVTPKLEELLPTPELRQTYEKSLATFEAKRRKRSPQAPQNNLG
jgi:hypothetical protein